MKTDELFYELFKIDPKSLFRLVQVELEGEYAFESLTIKTTEKRLDGFCKELESMLNLTPIEETVLGKELIQIGKHEGRKEGRQEGVKLGEKRGMTKGELIGAIRFAQKMLKQPVSPTVKLVRKSPTTLKAMLKALEAEFTPQP